MKNDLIKRQKEQNCSSNTCATSLDPPPGASDSLIKGALTCSDEDDDDNDGVGRDNQTVNPFVIIVVVATSTSLCANVLF